MLIVVTRFQFRLLWCSNGDSEDPWYLYLVGCGRSGSSRAACLGTVRKFRGVPRRAMWRAISYEDEFQQQITSPDRVQTCNMATSELLKQLFYPSTATAEWALQHDMDCADEWVMPLLSDLHSLYVVVEPVCLLN